MNKAILLLLCLLCATVGCAEPIRLANDRLAVVIDPQRGLITSGQDLKTGTAVYEQISGVYYLGRVKGPEPFSPFECRSVSESDDILVGGSESLKQAASATTFTARYTNPGLSDIIVEKTYSLAQGSTYVSKTVRLLPTRDLELGIEYGIDVTLAPAFREGSYYHCPMGIHFGQRIPTWMKADEVKQSLSMSGYPETQVGAGGHGLQSFVSCTSPQRNLSAVTYRYRENGRFVRPPWMAYLGAGVYLNERGWKMGVFSDYLAPGQDLSGEVHIQIINGDHVSAHRLWQILPEWQKLIHDPSVQNDRSPAWLDRVKVMGMVCEGVLGPEWLRRNYSSLVNEGPQMVMVAGPGVTVWSGDGAIGTVYFQDGGLYQKIDDYQIHSPQWMREFVDSFRAVAPGAKMGLYFLSPEISLKISPRVGRYDCHSWLSFFEGVKLPEDLQFMREQWRAAMRAHGADFIYMDGAAESGGAIDYQRKIAYHQYDAMDIDKAVRQAARDLGPDKVYWRNGEVNTYTDCGFAELSGVGDWADMVEQTGWRNLADRILKVKLYERPGKWVAPLYPGRGNEYMNYVLGLGFRPWGAPPSPLVNAMYEVRNMRLIDADIKPCWWRDYGEVEAHALALGGTRVLSAINHGVPPPGPLPTGEGGKGNGGSTPDSLTPRPPLPGGEGGKGTGNSGRQTAVSADRTLLGLEQKPVFIWQCRPLTNIKQGNLSDQEVQAAWQRRWAKGVAIDRRLIALQEKPSQRVGAELELPYNELRQLFITHVPALVYAANGYRRNYPLTDFNDITLRGSVDLKANRVSVTAAIPPEGAEVALVAPGTRVFSQVKVNGRATQFEPVREPGAMLAVVRLGAGTHRLEGMMAAAGAYPKLMLTPQGPAQGVAQYVPGVTGQGLYIAERSKLTFDGLGPWDMTRGSIELHFRPDFSWQGDTSHILMNFVGEKFSFTVYKLLKHDGLCFNIHDNKSGGDFALHAAQGRWETATWHRVRVWWDATAGFEEMTLDGQSIGRRELKLPDLTAWSGTVVFGRNLNDTWIGTLAFDDVSIKAGDREVLAFGFEGDVRDSVSGRSAALSNVVGVGEELEFGFDLTEGPADSWPLQRPAQTTVFWQLTRDGAPIFTQRLPGTAEGGLLKVRGAQLAIPPEADGGDYVLRAGLLEDALSPGLEVARLSVKARPPVYDLGHATEEALSATVVGHPATRVFTWTTWGQVDPTNRAAFDPATGTFDLAVGTGMHQSGAAAVGVEISGLQRLGCEFTLSDLVRQSRPALYMRRQRGEASFIGLMLDFRTSAGYVKRCVIGLDTLTLRTSTAPQWGWALVKQRQPLALWDVAEATKLGVPRKMAIDLRPLAPAEWDGTVIVSAVLQECLLHTRARLRLLPEAETAALPETPLEALQINPVVHVKTASRAPVIDGAVDEVWQEAQALKPFYDLGSITRARQQSVARLLRDEGNLYVLVECNDPEVTATYQGRDVAVWEQDDVEVFVQPTAAGPYYQFGVNAVGGRYDARGKEASYNREWEARTAQTAQGWAVEMRLPLAAVEQTQWGEWRLGIGRSERGGGGAELSSWPIYRRRDFHDAASWARLE